MITREEIKSILHNGLWKQNTGVVQLLGLCPLLAISNSVVNGCRLGLCDRDRDGGFQRRGVAVCAIFVPHEIRIPVFVLIIAVLVTVIDLAMNAFVHPHLSRARHLHPAHRHQLHRAGACGSVRCQEPRCYPPHSTASPWAWG